MSPTDRNSDLAERLRRRIAGTGPIPFRDWMDACLYDREGGFYMRGRPRTGAGYDSDFATNPTLHPFFARCVAEEIVATWSRLGAPLDFSVVEFGGGLGHLARDALAALDKLEPRLGKIVRWVHVEESPAHRAAQAGDRRVSWNATMPPLSHGFVVAHEFLDALPFHWLQWSQGRWVGVAVTWQDRFVETLVPASPEMTAAAPQGRFSEGQRVAVMSGVEPWFAQVSRGLGRGDVLVVDYGDIGDHLRSPDRMDGTVRGYRNHQLADIFEAPGETDITAGIDFDFTHQAGVRAGFVAQELETQELFLLRHGIFEALNDVPRTTREGASDYLRLRQLLLPTGFGSAFKVQRFWKG